MTLLLLLMSVLQFASVYGITNLDQDWILETFTGSYTDCKESCDTRVACLDIYYSRHHMLCILSKKEISLATKPFPRYSKDNSLKFEQENITGCESCSIENCRKDLDNFSCVVTVCSSPASVNGTTILGNRNVIGAKKIYKCTENKTANFKIKCQTNGTWSNNDNISCHRNLCSLKSSLQNGKWQMTRLNQSHFYANVTCDPGYELRMLETAICDSNTGQWFGLDWICCDIYKDFSYQKIYNAPAYIPGNVAQKLTEGQNLRDRQHGINCEYRNASIVDNWSSYNISFVSLRVIENGSEVAYMTFYGTGSTKVNWFSKSRLVNSSWYDLNQESETDIFSIWGNGGSVNTIRWFISGHVDLDDDCKTKVWLACTWHYHPCGNTSAYDAPRILYAKNNNISLFTADEMGFADKLEVWISPIP